MIASFILKYLNLKLHGTKREKLKINAHGNIS
jgi:hypothetical protein